MEKKSEILDEELVKKLKELNSKNNNLISSIGNAELDIYNLETEIGKVKQLKEKLIQQYSEINSELNIEMKILNSKYKNGVLDLDTGVIEYTI